MKYKKLRCFKGSTLSFDIPLSNNLVSFRRVVRAEVKKTEGAPVARFQTEYGGGVNIKCRLNPTDSIRLSGQYKYEVSVEDNEGIKTLQYGILEVL
ncbi:hypothetical protein L4D00_14900 [Photobacterium swingsii]|uniref:hypothetical protein n=1 Tax=Photobacterium swingsii TaxID=680026 RepID=UPI003D0DE95F